MEDFPIYKDEDRLTSLAYYYEQLARYLLHSPQLSFQEWLNTRGLRHYDIEDYATAYVEVKGVSNTDQLKLFEDQLDFQLKELGFPIDQGLVWIFSYINRGRKLNDDGNRPRLLKEESGHSLRELAQFLAKQTNVAYVLDIRLLHLLRVANGTQLYNRDKFHDRQAININRGTLKNLAHDARATLLQLGMSPEELPSWLPPKAQRLRPRYINACFDGNEVNFELFPILANGPKRQFLRQLNGTVRKSRP